MGREVYDGNPQVIDLWYHPGAQAGLLGLVLKSIVFALMSFAVKPLGRYIGGAKRLWGDDNVVLAICLRMTIMITKVAEYEHRAKVELSGPYANMPSSGIRAATFFFYVVVDIPLVV
jgi:solute carrier family 45, member 1/2/4